MLVVFLLVVVACSGRLHAQFEDALGILNAADTSVIIKPATQADTFLVVRYLSLVQRAHPEIRIAAAGVQRARGAETAAWDLLDPRITGS